MDVVRGLSTVDELLAPFGLKQNRSKLQLYSNDPAQVENVPAPLRPKFVPSLKILGQRLANRISSDGVPYSVGPDNAANRASPLNAAHDQMAHLGSRLRALTAAGLPHAVAHRVWVYATAGAIVHLQGVSLYTAAEMERFNEIQAHHVSWMTGRSLTHRDVTLALLPAYEGGGGLPNHARAALSNFLATQSRIARAVSSKLHLSTEEYLALHPALTTQLARATAAAKAQGATASTIPSPYRLPPDGGRRRKFTKSPASILAKTLHHAAQLEVLPSLSPGHHLRLKGQARRGSSLWMSNVLPGGEAPADATWATMLRQRLLLPFPGATPLPDDPTPRCLHSSVRGHQCPASADPDGLHEVLCGVGGGTTIRHDRTRDWLADKLRDACGGRTATEQPHPHADGTAGRMDIKHDSPFGHLDVDIIIPSLLTTNPRELLRRQQDPARAIRAAIASKHTTYGAGVLAFVMDDVGALGVKAHRLLHSLAVRAAGPVEGPATAMAWKAELQHLVLQATASMAQAARGQPRTA